MNLPNKIILQENTKYLYCSCGKSKDRTFCDGSHKGGDFTPLHFEVRNTSSYTLCRCKKTKNSPYCDNSHSS